MPVRWGIVGCGDVTEVKSGPGFQQARGSSLVAVMRRDRGKAEDYARRHGVPRAYDKAAALIADPGVDAVYVATPPSSHLEIALAVAAAGKPCLVEKPMAMTHAECARMVEAFAARGVPLWVAYYRRALPRFLEVRRRLTSGAIGQLTSVHVQVMDRLADGSTRSNWRFDPAVAGAGLFYDLASHCFDLLDFLAGPIADARGFPNNTAAVYSAEDVIATAFSFAHGAVGTGLFNFNADVKSDRLTLVGTTGTLSTPIFADEDVVVKGADLSVVIFVRNPPHVHQPLIQSIVDEIDGRGRAESTGESAPRAAGGVDRCLGRGL
jgi:1,5-anhydro-D-fructose reductase (1,5-anhydro-D-mannitol-forming)